MTVYLEDRVAKLEKQFDHIVACLAGLATSSVKLEKRMDALEQKVDRLEQRVDRIEQKVDRILEILQSNK